MTPGYAPGIIIAPAFRQPMIATVRWRGRRDLVNFVGFRAAPAELGRLLLPIATPIKVAAGFTLSIYLFHKPLILFFTALINGNPASLWFWVSVMASTTVTIIVLGLLTEHRKSDYRKFFDWLLA